jgi:hypothetical protein
MEFNYYEIFKGKTHIKKGNPIPYKCDVETVRMYDAVFEHLLQGEVPDFNDAGKVLSKLKEHHNWGDLTAGKKLSALSTLIRCMNDEELGKLGIRPTKKEDVLKAYCDLTKGVIKNAPSTQNRKKQKLSKHEENIWNKEQYDTYVEEKAKRGVSLIQKGTQNLSDNEKDELQQCALVLWYSRLKNVRALQHTIRKSGYSDYSNFIIKGYNRSPMVIIYNFHKLNQNTGIPRPIPHIFTYDENPVLYELIEKLYELWPDSPYLFTDFKNRRNFEENAFRKYLCAAHGKEIGSRLLRVMQKTDFHQACPSLLEVEEECALTGQTDPKQSAAYVRKF